jgi:hypothetical protein
LNQDRDCWELKGRFSVKLGGLAGMNKQYNCISNLDRECAIGI